MALSFLKKDFSNESFDKDKYRLFIEDNTLFYQNMDLLDNSCTFLIDYYHGRLICCSNQKTLSEDNQKFGISIADCMLSTWYGNKPMYEKSQKLMSLKKNKWTSPVLLHIQDYKTVGMNVFFVLKMTPLLKTDKGSPVISLARIVLSPLNKRENYLFDITTHEVYKFHKDRWLKAPYQEPIELEKQLIYGLYSGTTIRDISRYLHVNYETAKYHLKHVYREYGTGKNSCYTLLNMHFLGMSSLMQEDDKKLLTIKDSIRNRGGGGTVSIIPIYKLTPSWLL